MTAKHLISLLATAVMISVAAPARAQAPAPPPEPDLPLLPLDELLDEARSNNPSLAAARFEVDALQTVGRQVSALPDPTVMATYQPFPILTARGSQRAQLRVEQQIPYPGKLALQAEIADYTTEIAAHEADAYAEDLTLQVKHVYYELFRIQEQRNLLLLFQERLVQFEEAAAQQYHVGTGMQQSILKAQLEKNTISQRLIELADRRATAVENLSRLVDRPIEGDFEVQAITPEVPLAKAESLTRIAQTNRPEMHALTAAELRAEKHIDLAHKQFMPDFGVNVSYFDIAAADMPPTATGRDAVAVGLALKLPLQRGRLRAKLEETRAHRAKVAAQQEALLTSFRTRISELVSRMRHESEQLELYQNLLIPQAENTVGATLSAYTTGRIDFLDLLDAERMLFALQMSREDARTRFLKAAADLERALAVQDLTRIANLSSQSP